MTITGMIGGFRGIFGGAHDHDFVGTICLPSRHGEFYANAKCDSIKAANLPTKVCTRSLEKVAISCFFDNLLTKYFILIT